MGYDLRILEALDGGDRSKRSTFKDIMTHMPAPPSGIPDKRSLWVTTHLENMKKRGWVIYTLGRWRMTRDGEKALNHSTPKWAARMLKRKGKPSYKELVDFIRLYMNDDNGCGCEVCNVARHMLGRVK